MNYSKQDLVSLINQDPSLSPDEKREVIDHLNSDILTNHPGLTGAGVGFAISKFLNLSRRAQVLLTISGFGIGHFLLDSARKHDKFLQYNEKDKAYDIKS
jgi:hypothetical protein